MSARHDSPLASVSAIAEPVPVGSTPLASPGAAPASPAPAAFPPADGQGYSLSVSVPPLGGPHYRGVPGVPTPGNLEYNGYLTFGRELLYALAPAAASADCEAVNEFLHQHSLEMCRRRGLVPLLAGDHPSSPPVGDAPPAFPLDPVSTARSPFLPGPGSGAAAAAMWSGRALPLRHCPPIAERQRLSQLQLEERQRGGVQLGNDDAANAADAWTSRSPRLP